MHETCVLVRSITALSACAKHPAIIFDLYLGVRDCSERSSLCSRRFGRHGIFSLLLPDVLETLLYRRHCVGLDGFSCLAAGQVALLTCDYTAEQSSICEPEEHAADGRLPTPSTRYERKQTASFSVPLPECSPPSPFVAGGSFVAFALRWVSTRALARTMSRCRLHLDFAKPYLYACHSVPCLCSCGFSCD
jgi:hypothetical protein